MALGPAGPRAGGDPAARGPPRPARRLPRSSKPSQRSAPLDHRGGPVTVAVPTVTVPVTPPAGHGAGRGRHSMIIIRVGWSLRRKPQAASLSVARLLISKLFYFRVQLPAPQAGSLA
jgi:hypothetical protein